MSKKNKIIIALSAIIVLLIFIIGLFFYSMNPVSKESEKVIFKVESGSSKFDIIDNLKEANLIKSKLSAYLYVFLGNSNLQAGTYELDRNESLSEIINKINNGEIYRETFTITFVEGKRLTKYASLIAEKLKVEEKEVFKTIGDKEYLN